MAEDKKTFSLLPNREPTKSEAEMGKHKRKMALMEKGMNVSDATVEAHSQVEADRDRIRQALRYLESEKKAAEKEQESLTNAMTGLYNRRYFDQELPKKIENAERKEKPFSLLLIDLDKFKQVNDSMGYEVGDEALRIVSEILQESKREYDTAARFGGEEFAIMLEDTNYVQAMLVGNRIRKKVQNELKNKLKNKFPNYKDEISQTLGTISVGVASFQGGKEENGFMSPERIIRGANQLLKRSKQQGRNAISFVDLSHPKHTQEEIDAELQKIADAGDEDREDIYAALERSQKMIDEGGLNGIAA